MQQRPSQVTFKDYYAVVTDDAELCFELILKRCRNRYTSVHNLRADLAQLHANVKKYHGPGGGVKAQHGEG